MKDTRYFYGELREAFLEVEYSIENVKTIKALDIAKEVFNNEVKRVREVIENKEEKLTLHG